MALQQAAAARSAPTVGRNFLEDLVQMHEDTLGKTLGQLVLKRKIYGRKAAASAFQFVCFSPFSFHLTFHVFL